MYKIFTPQSNSNDEFVFIAEWKFKNNEFVKKGDHLLSIETSKVVEEIFSENEGYLEKLYDENSKVKVGEVVGILNDKKKLSDDECTGKPQFSFIAIETTSDRLGRSFLSFFTMFSWSRGCFNDFFDNIPIQSIINLDRIMHPFVHILEISDRLRSHLYFIEAFCSKLNPSP